MENWPVSWFFRNLLKIQATPGAWGFREMRRPVLEAGATLLEVPDARGFLWWDAWGHLSTAFHRVLATLKAHAAAAEPS